MDLVVACSDVNVTSLAPSGDIDLLGNLFIAQPVAVVVSIASIHGDSDALLDESAHVFNGVGFAAVVTRSTKSVAYNTGIIGPVCIRANSSLHLGCVQVLGVEVIGKRITAELSDVVLIAIGIIVQEAFHIASAEAVGTAACSIVTWFGAVFSQARETALGSVNVIVEFLLDSFVIGRVVVGVAREDGKVVECLVLDVGVVPVLR